MTVYMHTSTYRLRCSIVYTIHAFFLHDQRDFTLALHACIRWTCFVSSRQQLVSRTPRYTATRKVTLSQKLELQRHLLLTTFNWFNTNLSTNKSKWTWKSLRVCGPMGLAQELFMTHQVAWKVQVPSQLSTLCKSCIDYCTKKKGNGRRSCLSLTEMTMQTLSLICMEWKRNTISGQVIGIGHFRWNLF